jgi:hypothetical protein
LLLGLCLRTSAGANKVRGAFAAYQ